MCQIFSWPTGGDTIHAIAPMDCIDSNLEFMLVSCLFGYCSLFLLSNRSEPCFGFMLLLKGSANARLSNSE